MNHKFPLGPMGKLRWEGLSRSAIKDAIATSIFGLFREE